MNHPYNFIDLTGKKFNRLTIIAFDGVRNKRTFWLCRCDCGNIKSVEAYRIKRGVSKSCGCFQKEETAKRNKLLVTTHGMTGTRIHNIWIHMRNRCENPNNQAYKWYGKRGIKVCKRWKHFENFLEDMKESYSRHILEYGVRNTTIDRENNEGNYELSNCRWATYAIQNKNKRMNKISLSRAGKLGAIARWGK